MSAWIRLGQMIFSNEEVAKYTRAYPDRIFGLVAVNLHDPVQAAKELEHYVRLSPLYVKCIELDVPFFTQVDHTGPRVRARSAPRFHTSTPSRSNSLTLRSSRGISDPWATETTAAEWKHKNVYIDTSAWSPKYYAPELITFANTTGREKVMFGTNFPQLGWKDCVDNVDRYLVGTERV